MTVAAGLLHNLTELFSGMSVVSFILTVVGIILIVTEYFQPSRGYLSVCGAVLTVSGIIVRMLSGGTFIMLFFMIFFIVTILFAAHIIMLIFQKKEWLMQSVAFKLENAYAAKEGEYGFLLGRDGLATTDIDCNGQILIDNIHFFVTSSGFIPSGSVVRVIRVEGDRIDVAQVEEDDE